MQVSTRLNLIVGQRGSGKTFLLNRIAEDKNDNVYKLEQFDTTSNRQEFLKKQQEKRGRKVYNKFMNQYSNAWELIKKVFFNFNDENDINTYLEDLKNYAVSYSSRGQVSQIKIFKEHDYEIMNIDLLKIQLKNLFDFINNKDVWNHISKNYRHTFLDAYCELRKSLIDIETINRKKDKVNGILAKIKKVISKQNGVIEPPSINFTEFFKKQKVVIEADKFLSDVIFDNPSGRVLARENINGYQIVIKLVPFKDGKSYQRLFHTNDAVVQSLLVPYNNKDFYDYFYNLKEKDFFDVDHLTDFIAKLDVTLETPDGNKASGGQEVAFALLMGLEEAKNYDIALIDEPEASLDNVFIRKTLIPKIRDLAKNTTTFVVTHNSTLGTLLDPNYLIVAKNISKNKYGYYSGNFKSSKIKDYKGNIFNSSSDFIQAMEAGISTYKEKGDVYEKLKDR